MNDLMQRIVDGALAEAGSIIVGITVTFLGRILRVNSNTKEKLYNEKDLKDFKLDNLKELTQILLKEGELSTNDFLKMKNLIEIADIADKHFMNQNPNKASKESFQNINWDWMMRFFDAVGNISDKELHVLWAKILAGELSKNNSFSLRAIDILKNFSVEDARNYHKICNHSFESGNNVFIPSDEMFRNYADITFEDILALDDLGLVNSSSFALSYSCNKLSTSILEQNDRLVLVVNNNSDSLETYGIMANRFTALGKELRSTMEFDIHDKDILALRDCFRKNEDNKNLYFSVHRIQGYTDVGIQYDTNEVIA